MQHLTHKNMQKLHTTYSPLDQFEIRDLISVKINLLNNIQISLTNMGIFLIISLAIIMIMHLLSTNFNYLTPNN